jgi:hypothetical protein
MGSNAGVVNGSSKIQQMFDTMPEAIKNLFPFKNGRVASASNAGTAVIRKHKNEFATGHTDVKMCGAKTKDLMRAAAAGEIDLDLNEHLATEYLLNQAKLSSKGPDARFRDTAGKSQ